MDPFHQYSTELWGFSKLVVKTIGERLRFAHAFEYASEQIKGERCLLANADIYFPTDSLVRLLDPQLNLSKILLALTRWENEDVFYPRIDQQDSWVFESRVPNEIIRLCNYPLGFLRSDNRLARIFQQNKYQVLNPSVWIQSIHLHASSERAYTEEEHTIPGEFAYVPVSLELKR